MKIKHFAGYGFVEATKKSKRKLSDGTTELVLKVRGDHEWGIVRDDVIDVYGWLVKRFFKAANSWQSIKSMNITSYMDDGIEAADYRLLIKNN